jgi:DUF1365 family protein
MSGSALYLGRVEHRRFLPVEHRLSYGVWYLLLDLDELPEIDRRVPGFGVDRAAPVSFHRRDHGPRDGTPLRPWIGSLLDGAGVEVDGGPIRVLCFPRVLGYVFNPLSVWFAHGRDGALRALVYEVSNTFGGWHHYVVPVDDRDQGPVVRAVFDKELFVSPFIGMDSTYDFRTRVPDDRLAVTVRQTEPEGHVLTATLTGRQAPLTGATLRSAFVRYPLVTLKAMGGIHWEALKLWRKGAPFRRHEPMPARTVTVVRPAAGERIGAPA